MVKRREPKSQSQLKQVEAFVSGADRVELNPNAPRTYKAIRVPFNEYEFKKLEELAAKTSRAKLNVLR